MHPEHVPVGVAQEQDQFQHSNHTPCHFKGERLGKLRRMLALSIRWDVLVWQWGCGRCWGRTHFSPNHFKILHARDGLTKAGRQQRAGGESRKVWQGLAQFALSSCHLVFLAYKEHTALVIAYIEEKMYSHRKAEANPGRTYVGERTLALLQVAQFKDVMLQPHLVNPSLKLLLIPLHNLIIPISAGLNIPPQRENCSILTMQNNTAVQRLQHLAEEYITVLSHLR